MTSTITVTSPGKLLLCGDHAVVYGYPCVVTAVDQRLTLSAALITVTDQPCLHISAPDVNLLNYQKPLAQLGQGEIPKAAAFLEQTTRFFLSRFPGAFAGHSIQFETQSQFSSQFGFGSSSASTAAGVVALAQLCQLELSHHELFDIAYKAILAVQGVGSGFDLASALWGGTITYVTPAKVVEPLQVDKLPIVVGYTGVKADTATLVKQVQAQLAANPVPTKELFEEIGKTAQAAQTAIVDQNWLNLGTSFTRCQQLLVQLNVSSPQLDALISASLAAGAYGAKLSGAGGGDCMIAVVESGQRSAVEAAITQAGGQVMPVTLNAPATSVIT